MKTNKKMKRSIVALTIVIGMFQAGFAHDLFLKLDSFFASVGDKLSIKVLNGSFMASEGAVSYQRLADLSVVSPSGNRTKPAENDFTKDNNTAFLGLKPTEAGNYLVGLSTMTREIDLDGKSFNEYLTEDGIPDILAERQRDNELEKSVRERYSKHVKTLIQVGEKQMGNFNQRLGYPVEIVPKNNPYKLRPGDKFKFICLKDGKPLANQYVMSGYDDGTNLRMAENIRTDKNGVGRVTLNAPGKWYVKFIQMTKLNDPKINYESKWATFTFEIK